VGEQLECWDKNLQAEIKELKEQVHQDKWTIFGLMNHMEQMEARTSLLHNPIRIV